MDIIVKPPPNIKAINKAFPITLTQRGIIYTYGNAIFSPDDGNIDEPLLLHESTHSLQQEELGKGKTGAERWWKKYIKDPVFRFEQELEAYRNEYRRFCELVSDRNRRALRLHRIATALSSEQYGNCCTLEEVKRLVPIHAELR